jgi:hypothetical protein
LFISSWNRERNTAMKVFSKLFVGVRPKSASAPIPLAFATPYEENAQGRKRQDSVRGWLGGHREYERDENGAIKRAADGSWIEIPHEKDERIVENVPLPGFKITDDVKRVYWGGGNVVWRVEDPRGYELEIQSQNLMAIIQSAGISEGGLIPGSCVWGRSGADNILLHESSDEYKDAVKAAETLKAPRQVGKSSRRIGGLYRRVNGSTAIYIAKIHVTKMDYASEDATSREFYKLGDVKAIMSVQQYNIPASAEFEGMLEVEEGGEGQPLATKTLTMYKKAPLVDDLGDVAIPEITNSFLMGLSWQFASSSISAARVLRVGVDPILNPVPALRPWTPERFAERLASIKLHIAHNCRVKTYQQRYPLSSLLAAWKCEDILCLGDKLYGSIDTLGDSYVMANRPAHMQQRLPSFDVALPVTLQPGSVIFRSGTDNFSKALQDSHAWSSYLYRDREDRLSRMTECKDAVHMPDFTTEAEFLEYVTALYNGAQLFTLTVKEAHA